MQPKHQRWPEGWVWPWKGHTWVSLTLYQWVTRGKEIPRRQLGHCSSTTLGCTCRDGPWVDNGAKESINMCMWVNKWGENTVGPSFLRTFEVLHKHPHSLTHPALLTGSHLRGRFLAVVICELSGHSSFIPWRLLPLAQARPLTSSTPASILNAHNLVDDPPVFGPRSSLTPFSKPSWVLASMVRA